MFPWRVPQSDDRAMITARFAIGLASLIGLIGYLWPFLIPFADLDGPTAATQAAPFLLAGVTGLCLLAILGELSSGSVRPSRIVALLGVLVAINATLRLLPTFLGVSPVFLLIILVGAVFGGTIGFQLGALSLLVSAFLTGGVGPWLPYQMLGAGWVGLTAGLLPRLEDAPRWRLVVLAVFGAVWGTPLRGAAQPVVLAIHRAGPGVRDQPVVGARNGLW